MLPFKDGGMFPDMSEPLNFFTKSFDLNAAKRTGSIEPKAGMDAEYDASLQEMKEIKSELEEVLNDLKQGSLRGSGVKWYTHTSSLYLYLFSFFFCVVKIKYAFCGSSVIWFLIG